MLVDTLRLAAIKDIGCSVKKGESVKVSGQTLLDLAETIEKLTLSVHVLLKHTHCSIEYCGKCAGIQLLMLKLNDNEI